MTKKFNAKLKPCPFCGGMRPHACICAQRWAVRCPECGAMVMSDSADDGGKSAAKRWNARASEEDRRTVRTCRMRVCEDARGNPKHFLMYVCSECHGAVVHDKYDPIYFCPSCGRKVENMVIEPGCDTCRDGDATCRGKAGR